MSELASLKTLLAIIHYRLNTGLPLDGAAKLALLDEIEKEMPTLAKLREPNLPSAVVDTAIKATASIPDESLRREYAQLFATSCRLDNDRVLEIGRLRENLKHHSEGSLNLWKLLDNIDQAFHMDISEEDFRKLCRENFAKRFKVIPVVEVLDLAKELGVKW